MNGDRLVLRFDFEDTYIEVVNNEFLPFELRDYVKTTTSTIEGVKKTLSDIETLKDFLVSRTLNLSRQNAKNILNIAALPQSLKISERMKIALCCHDLIMTDQFWIKKDTEDIRYSSVDLKKKRLSDASYEIAILGKRISATQEELIPDLSTLGMAPKYWHQKDGEVFISKTDTDGASSVESELRACSYLEKMGIDCVHYDSYARDGIRFAISKCIANEQVSLIHAQAVRDWCAHTNRDFLLFVTEKFLTEFSNMCVCDYVFGNTDRHFENWGFIVDNNTNEIISFAPLYDHNQAFLCDNFHTDINELIYEPCNTTYLLAIKRYAPYSTADFSKLKDLSIGCSDRVNVINECLQMGRNNV